MAVLITGHLRSGTSMLARLCASHPDIALTHEFGPFLCAGRSRARYLRRLLKRWAGIGFRGWPLVATPGKRPPHAHVLGQNHLLVLRYLFSLLAHSGRKIDIPTIERALARILPRARLVGDKYPGYVFVLDDLMGLDGLRPVVIYRDPRDVVHSALQASRNLRYKMPQFARTIDTAEKVARRWVRSIEIMERNRDWMHCIRYEAIARGPLPALDSLGRWLGVDPDGFDGSAIRQDAIGKHRQGLSREQLADTLRIAGPTMDALGYRR